MTPPVKHLERPPTTGPKPSRPAAVAVDREPWERQPDEPATWHSAFMRYCEMGPSRSLQRVADERHTPLSTVQNRSADWHWRARQHAWSTAKMSDDEMALREVRAKAAVGIVERADAQVRFLAQSFIDDAGEMDAKDRTRLGVDLAKLVLASNREPGAGGPTVNVAVNVSTGPTPEAQLAVILAVLQHHPEVRDVIQGELVREFGRG